MSVRSKETKATGSRLVNGLIITSAVLSVIMVCVLVILVLTIIKKDNTGTAPAEELQSATAEELQPARFSSGSVYVNHNGWTSMRLGSSITIYHEGSEKYKLTGKMDYNLLAAEEGLYYTKDQGFYYCSYADGSETLLMEYSSLIHPIGMIGEKFFFTSAPDNAMQFSILQYDSSTQAVSELALPELWGDVEMIFCNDHFYYIGGRTDVSTRPLYEVDIEKGEARQIDPACGSGLLSYGSKVYYSHAEPAGSIPDATMSLTELDTETGTKKEISRTAPGKMKTPVFADSNYIYLLSYGAEESRIVQLNVKDGTETAVITGPGLSVIGECENGFYYSSTGQSESTVLFQFNESDGSTKEIGTVKGSVLGYADNYVYYSIYNQNTKAQEYYRTRF